MGYRRAAAPEGGQAPAGDDFGRYRVVSVTQTITKTLPIHGSLLGARIGRGALGELSQTKNFHRRFMDHRGIMSKGVG